MYSHVLYRTRSIKGEVRVVLGNIVDHCLTSLEIRPMFQNNYTVRHIIYTIHFSTSVISEYIRKRKSYLNEKKGYE